MSRAAARVSPLSDIELPGGHRITGPCAPAPPRDTANLSQFFSIHPDNPQLRLIRQAVDILRKAFNDTMADAQFLADAEKMKISITPLPGAEVQDVIGKLYATPKEFVERAKTSIKP